MQKFNHEQMTKSRQDNPNAKVINVLPKDSFTKESINGSKNVPFKDNADFAAQIESITGGKDKPVTLYCASSECSTSSDAATALETAGFSKVAIYEGGMKEWTEKSTKSKVA